MESTAVDEELELNFIKFNRTGDNINIGIVYRGNCPDYQITYYELDNERLMEIDNELITVPEISVNQGVIFGIVAISINDTICSDVISQRNIYSVKRNGMYNT